MERSRHLQWTGSAVASGTELTYEVRDETTRRVLPLLIRYPANVAGPLPVVFWSHGGGFGAAAI